MLLLRTMSSIIQPTGLDPRTQIWIGAAGVFESLWRPFDEFSEIVEKCRFDLIFRSVEAWAHGRNTELRKPEGLWPARANERGSFDQRSGRHLKSPRDFPVNVAGNFHQLVKAAGNVFDVVADRRHPGRPLRTPIFPKAANPGVDLPAGGGARRASGIAP